MEKITLSKSAKPIKEKNTLFAIIWISFFIDFVCNLALHYYFFENEQNSITIFSILLPFGIGIPCLCFQTACSWSSKYVYKYESNTIPVIWGGNLNKYFKIKIKATTLSFKYIGLISFIISLPIFMLSLLGKSSSIVIEFFIHMLYLTVCFNSAVCFFLFTQAFLLTTQYRKDI
ncbi:TPA: hypothetical protein QB352_001472 [Pasteurella multocida]|nr:hypothetical protein [Pasteurella multocida]